MNTDHQVWEEARKIIEDLAAYHKNYPPGMYSPGSPAHTVNIEIEERAVAWVEKIAALQRSVGEVTEQGEKCTLPDCDCEIIHSDEGTSYADCKRSPNLRKVAPSQPTDAAEELYPFREDTENEKWHNFNREQDLQQKAYIAGRKHSSTQGEQGEETKNQNNMQTQEELNEKLKAVGVDNLYEEHEKLKAELSSEKEKHGQTWDAAVERTQWDGVHNPDRRRPPPPDKSTYLSKFDETIKK